MAVNFGGNARTVVVGSGPPLSVAIGSTLIHDASSGGGTQPDPNETIITLSKNGNLTGGGTADLTEATLADLATYARSLNEDEKFVVEIDAIDGPIEGSGNMLEFRDGDGWGRSETWAPNSRIIVRPRAGSEHDGTDNGGAKLRLTNNGTCVQINGTRVLVEDIIMEIAASAAYSQCVLTTSLHEATVQRCVLIHDQAHTSNRIIEFKGDSSFSIGGWFVHNIIYETGGGTRYGIWARQHDSAVPLVIAHNTIYGDFEAGIEADGHWPELTNNLVECTGTGVAFANIGSATSGGGNIGHDATSPDGASFQNLTATYVDAANGDLHLDASDTAATGAGVAVTIPAPAEDRDIDGNAPGATRDVGAHQISAGT